MLTLFSSKDWGGGEIRFDPIMTISLEVACQASDLPYYFHLIENKQIGVGEVGSCTFFTLEVLGTPTGVRHMKNLAHLIFNSLQKIVEGVIAR